MSLFYVKLTFSNCSLQEEEEEKAEEEEEEIHKKSLHFSGGFLEVREEQQQLADWKH